MKLKKRGQLGLIEFKFLMMGFFAGLILSLVLVYLGNVSVLPFKIPLVCGSLFFLNPNSIKSKKGQLGMIEFQYFMVGLAAGLVAGLVLVYLSTSGILPFKIPLVCGSITPTK